MTTQIKICGITNLEDALFAAEHGADYLGFNFYNKSKRYILPNVASEIIKQIPLAVSAVGVFVNATKEEVDRIAFVAAIKYLQFHGDEDLAFVAQFKDQMKIKALQLKSYGLEKQIEEWLKVCDYLLLDAYSSQQYGGTGENIDNALLDYYSQRIDFSKIFLAGGLNPNNVLEKVRRYHPYAVDVASGVESSPGIKDKKLVSDFIASLN